MSGLGDLAMATATTTTITVIQANGPVHDRVPIDQPLTRFADYPAVD